MTHKIDDEKLMAEYLMGRLSEEDQAQIEERFLKDKEYLECLQDIEEDLNDSYVRGELSDHERELFEKRISASPEWMQRVEFARALTAVGTTPAEATAIQPGDKPQSISWWEPLLAFLRAQNPAFNLVLLTSALAILAFGSWLMLENRRLRTELQQLRAERQQLVQRLQQQTDDASARVDQLGQELERERGQREQLQSELEKSPPEQAIISFLLLPGVGRGGDESTKLEVPRNARIVRLNLYLQGPTPYKSYRTELRTAGGQPVWSRDGLSLRQTRTGRAIAVSLPASALTSGKFEMILKGIITKDQIEDVEYYYFNIVKK
jgi:hypothetical protein